MASLVPRSTLGRLVLMVFLVACFASPPFGLVVLLLACLVLVAIQHERRPR